MQANLQPQSDAPRPVFDEDGFLLEQSAWDEGLAEQIACEEGIPELTQEHWRVLEQVRAKFFQVGALPNLRRLCRDTALSRTQIHLLFGGCKSIWRIAGLPNPGEEAKTYLI